MIRPLAPVFVLAFALIAGPLAAQELTMPRGSRLLTDRIGALDSYDMPTGIFADGAVPSRHLEGRVELRTWRVQAGASTTLQLLAPLRAQIEEQGFEIVFECEARDCGGFDFRFGTEVVPTPDMYVAIHDYRFLSATRDDEALSLLVSRNVPDGYIQLIRVTPVTQDAPPPPLVTVEPDEGPGWLLGDLQRDGHVILSDLTFETGSSALGEGPFASLSELAGFLADTPTARLALVGHTDNVGTMDANIAVSRRRAEAVRQRMIDRHGADAARIEAHGVGYLVPVTSNSTPEGRDLNRRVEAVLLGG